MTEIDRFRALLRRAGEALDFYGDPSKYPAPLTGGMGALWSDCGTTAHTVAREIKEAVGRWVTVRVEDTCDGLMIHPDDAVRHSLEWDVQLETKMLDDTTARVFVPAKRAQTKDPADSERRARPGSVRRRGASVSAQMVPRHPEMRGVIHMADRAEMRRHLASVAELAHKETGGDFFAVVDSTVNALGLWIFQPEDRYERAAKFDTVSEMRRLVRIVLDAHAATPIAPQDLREAVAEAFRVRNGCSPHRGCENEDEPGGCACLTDVDTALSAICATHAIVPRDPTEAVVARAVSTASERAYSDETGLHRTFEVPTLASMRAALVEYAEKGNV